LPLAPGRFLRISEHVSAQLEHFLIVFSSLAELFQRNATRISNKFFYESRCHTASFVRGRPLEIRMQRIFTLILAFHVCSHAAAADIVETATTGTTFKTFLTAIKASGMTDTLKHDGPYTVFAPSDEAFAKLPPGTMEALIKDRKKLAQLLAHHIVPGKILVAQIKPGKVEALDGEALTLASDNGKVTVDEANVTQSDVQADNGVIHEVDTVIMPTTAATEPSSK
jgi:uncharacterized surface protein with fasciclin (FAS1) repeats